MQCNFYRDRDHNLIALWPAPQQGHVGGVLTATGEMKPLRSGALRCGVDASLSPTALLGRLRARPAAFWDLAFTPADGRLTVWPRLQARGALDGHRFVPPRRNPFAADADVAAAEALLLARRCICVGAVQQGGSTWTCPQGLRVAQVIPENEAVPAHVRTTLRACGTFEMGAEPPRVELPVCCQRQRPKGYRQGVRQTVFETAREWNGRVYDAATGWQLRDTDSWHMGHRPGFEFWKHLRHAGRHGLSRRSLLDGHNVSGRYQVEHPSTNISHLFEDPTPRFLAGQPLPTDLHGNPYLGLIYPLDRHNPKWRLVRAYRAFVRGPTPCRSFAECLEAHDLAGLYRALLPPPRPQVPLAELEELVASMQALGWARADDAVSPGQ